MRLLLLIWVGTMASAILLGTLFGGVLMQLSGGYPRGKSGMIDSVGGLVGAILWVIFSLGARNITQVSNGTVIRTSNDPLALLGVVMAVLSLVIGMVGVTILIDVRDIQLGA